MKNIKFIKTPCDALAVVLTAKDTVACCEGTNKKLVANTTDAVTEKHVPEVTVNGDVVDVVVGSVEHPMLDNHYIEFIALETDKGVHVRVLHPGEKPAASFVVKDEKPVAVYEYCNLHGLWVKNI